MSGEVSRTDAAANIDVEEVLSLLTWDDFGSQPKTSSVFDSVEDDSDDEALSRGGEEPVIAQEAVEELEMVVAVSSIPEDDAVVDAALESIFSDIAREKAAQVEKKSPLVPVRQVVRGISSGATFELAFEQLQKWNEDVMQQVEDEEEEGSNKGE